MSRGHDPNLIDAIMSFGVDVRARTVYLQSALDMHEHEEENGKRAVQHAIRALRYLDKHSADPIDLWVSTPGGPSCEMFAVYDVIRECRSLVRTVGHGEIASAGVLLLAAGDKRVVTPNAWLMSHAESGSDMSTHDTWTQQQRAAWQARTEKRWSELMGRHTKKTAKWWYDLHQGRKRELWLDSKQMVSYGIADSIMMPPDPPG